MCTLERALLISLALHVGGAGAAMGLRSSSEAHAEWRGEQPSVHWTVRFSPRPSMIAPREPEVEAPPSTVAKSTPVAPPEQEPPPPPLPPPVANEPAPPVPAPDLVGARGPELPAADVPKPPPEPAREPIAETTPTPPPAPEQEAAVTPPATLPATPAPQRTEPSPPAAPEAKDSTMVEPSPLPGHNPTPPYPFVAWRRRIQGSVLVSLRIDTNGAVIEGHVARSSGNTMLDDAALTTLKTWKFAPARDALGVHECTHEREVVFRIRS